MALDCEERVRAAGAVPATVGVLDGVVRVGLGPGELERFAASPDARKVGPRDLAACAAQGALGATTVGGTLAVARAAGLRFMGTGGLGGVHRGFAETLDVSADLGELARTPALVVASGAKSILDVPATAEVLETPRRSRARLAHGRDPALLPRGRRAARLGPGRVGRGGGARRRAPTGRSGEAGSSSHARRTRASTSSPSSPRAWPRRSGEGSGARRSRRSCSPTSTSEAAARRSRRTRR